MITINISGHSGDGKFRIVQAGLIAYEGDLKDKYNADNLYCAIGRNISQNTTYSTCHHNENNSGIDL